MGEEGGRRKVANRTIVLIGKSGKRHSFAPSRDEGEEIKLHARHLGEEVERVEELRYCPTVRSAWERRPRPDLLALLAEKEE